MWFETLPWAYSEIEAPISHISPLRTSAKAWPIWAFPSRSAFTSVPLSTMPASTRSRSS